MNLFQIRLPSKKSMSETIYGVLNHGSIVHADPHADVLITMGNTKMIYWQCTGNGGRYRQEFQKEFLGYPSLVRAKEIAKEWFKEILNSSKVDIEIDIDEW